MYVFALIFWSLQVSRISVICAGLACLMRGICPLAWSTWLPIGWIRCSDLLMVLMATLLKHGPLLLLAGFEVVHSLLRLLFSYVSHDIQSTNGQSDVSSPSVNRVWFHRQTDSEYTLRKTFDSQAPFNITNYALLWMKVRIITVNTFFVCELGSTGSKTAWE